MKKCNTCQILKVVTEFRFRTDRSSYRNKCLACESVYLASYREENRDKLNLASAENYLLNKNKILSDKVIYYDSNKEDIKAQKRQYRELNRERLAVLSGERRKKDLNFKLRLNLRSRLNKAIKNNQKIGSAVDDLGCSIEELRSYLESKFLPGMSWNNWSRDGWHIDHIEPLSSFDLSDIKQFKEACHYTNLQPLWAEDNLRKSGRIFR